MLKQLSPNGTNSNKDTLLSNCAENLRATPERHVRHTPIEPEIDPVDPDFDAEIPVFPLGLKAGPIGALLFKG